jgi:hypothetical protein
VHEEVNEMEYHIVSTCVDIDKKAYSFPCERGYLRGYSGKHDHFVVLALESRMAMFVLTALLIEINEPCSTYKNHHNNIPMVFLLSNFTIII